jgi:hypothetical protein
MSAHIPPSFERHHSDSDADCTMQTVGAEEEEKSMAPTSADAPLSSVPHLHIDSAEDDAASVGADLLSPCTLGVLTTATAASATNDRRDTGDCERSQSRDLPSADLHATHKVV